MEWPAIFKGIVAMIIAVAIGISTSIDKKKLQVSRPIFWALKAGWDFEIR